MDKDKVAEVLGRLMDLVQQEPMHMNCHIKIKRGEISAPMAFIKGKDEGARLLALDIIAIIEGVDDGSN